MISFFNKKYYPYLLLQRSRIESEYGMSIQSTSEEICAALNTINDRDLNLIKKYLPNSVETVADIGCGLCLIDLGLARIFPTAKFWCLDKTEMDNGVVSGFHQDYTFYNELDLVKEFLVQNGLNESRFYLIEHPQEIPAQPYDLILSLLSCGWHYPVGKYLNFIQENLSKDGALVIDVRLGNSDVELLERNFSRVTRLYNDAETTPDGGVKGYRYICQR